MTDTELVYVGIKGSAIALNRETGKIVWETHLKGSGFVHLVLDGNNLYATAQGEIFCLDAATGEGRWNNELKGYGWGLACIATRNVPNGSIDLAAQAAEEERQRSDSGGVVAAASS